MLFDLGTSLHQRISFHMRNTKRVWDNQKSIVATMKDCLKLSTIHLLSCLGTLV